MLKSILEKAINGISDAGELFHDDLSDRYIKAITWGMDIAKSEMRAKIPQVVEEVRNILKNLPQDERDWEEWLFKSLTENK